jgi:hypothetical protein
MLDLNKIGPEILEVVKKQKEIVVTEEEQKKIINICLKKIFEKAVTFKASQRIAYKEIIKTPCHEKQKEIILHKISQDIGEKIIPFLKVEEAQNDLRKEIDLNFIFSFIPLQK